MRTALVVLGVLVLAMGLLWIGQGTGLIVWPRSSFMINQGQWAWYGLATAVIGLALLLVGIKRS